MSNPIVQNVEMFERMNENMQQEGVLENVFEIG